MRVMVDGLSAHTGGGVTYLSSLVDAVLRLDDTLAIDMVLPSSGSALAGLAASERIRLHVPFARPPSLAARLMWEQVRLPALSRDVGADVLFAPAEVAPLRSRTPVVLGFQNPNLYARPAPISVKQRVRMVALRLAARVSARRARSLVFVSEPFRRVALEALGVGNIPARVVSPGIDRVFRGPRTVVNPFAVHEPFVLTVSDVYAYKNLPLLVSAFARVRAARPALRLLIAGRPVHADAVAELEGRIRELALADAVTVLGSVPLAEMPALYDAAECLVFPSLLESYGFPPLEAMARRTPVVCSSASVMPEVCGDAAHYFDPRSVDDCARSISVVLDDAALRSSLVERGEIRASLATWEEAGGAFIAACREAVA